MIELGLVVFFAIPVICKYMDNERKGGPAGHYHFQEWQFWRKKVRREWIRDYIEAYSGKKEKDNVA